jgi:hypothetical protein
VPYKERRLIAGPWLRPSGVASSRRWPACAAYSAGPLGAVKTINIVEFPGVPGVKESFGALLIEDMALVRQDGVDAVDEHDDREQERIASQLADRLVFLILQDAEQAVVILPAILRLLKACLVPVVNELLDLLYAELGQAMMGKLAIIEAKGTFVAVNARTHDGRIEP